MDGIRAEAVSESTNISLAMKRETDGTCNPVDVARDMLSCSAVRAVHIGDIRAHREGKESLFISSRNRGKRGEEMAIREAGPNCLWR